MMCSCDEVKVSRIASSVLHRPCDVGTWWKIPKNCFWRRLNDETSIFQKLFTKTHQGLFRPYTYIVFVQTPLFVRHHLRHPDRKTFSSGFNPFLVFGYAIFFLEWYFRQRSVLIPGDTLGGVDCRYLGHSTTFQIVYCTPFVHTHPLSSVRDILRHRFSLVAMENLNQIFSRKTENLSAVIHV